MRSAGAHSQICSGGGWVARLMRILERRWQGPLKQPVWLSVALAWAAILCGWGCYQGPGGGPSLKTPVERAQETGLRVGLIALDGAQWEAVERLLERGELPNTAKLLEGGLHGELNSHSQQTDAELLWSEAFTGRRTPGHGLQGIAELVGSKRWRPVNATQRRVLSLWNVLGELGHACTLVGFPVTWPAERIRGNLVSERFAGHLMQYWVPLVDSGPLAFPPELNQRLLPQRPKPQEFARSSMASIVNVGDGEWRESLALRPLPGHRWSTLRFALAAQFANEEVFGNLLREAPANFQALYLGALDPVSEVFWNRNCPEQFGRAPEEWRPAADPVSGLLRRFDATLGSLLEQLGPNGIILVVSTFGFEPKGNGAYTVSSELIPPGTLLDPPDKIEMGVWAERRARGFYLAGGAALRTGIGPQLEPVDLFPLILRLLGAPIPWDLDGELARDPAGPAAQKLFEAEFLNNFEVRRLRSFEDWWNRTDYLGDQVESALETTYRFKLDPRRSQLNVFR